ERRAGDPRHPVRAPGPRDRGRLGDDRAAVARRRLPPLHRARVRRRGRGGDDLRSCPPVRVLTDTWWMIVRQARNLMREPIWIALLLIQPMIWLLLYGQLFSRVPSLRGGASTYVEFLLPGIV